MGKLQNFVIETGNSSNGYYIKFSNGFIIQWGTSNAGENKTITLPKAFKDTNYNIQLSLVHNGGTSDGWWYHRIKTISSNSFIYGTADASGKVKWYACGY